MVGRGLPTQRGRASACKPLSPSDVLASLLVQIIPQEAKETSHRGERGTIHSHLL